MDQFLLAELLSSLGNNASRWLWPSLEAACDELPGYLPGGNLPHTWPWETVPRSMRPVPELALANGALRKRHHAWNDHDRDMFFAFDIRLPPELRDGPGGELVERVLRAPDFMFDGERALLLGWNSPGWLKPAYAAISHLVATGHSYGGAEAPVRASVARMHFLAVHGYWHGTLPPTPRTLLSLSLEPVLRAVLAGEPELRALIDALVRHAAALNRTPLMPWFPCRAAKWLPLSTRSAHGFDLGPHGAWAVAMGTDWLAVEPDTAPLVPQCTPYLGGHECALGDVWFHYLPNHHSRTVVQPGVTLETMPFLWLELEQLPNALPKEEEAAQGSSLRQRCPAYFQIT
jgi:hypothetical protein